MNKFQRLKGQNGFEKANPACKRKAEIGLRLSHSLRSSTHRNDISDSILMDECRHHLVSPDRAQTRRNNHDIQTTRPSSHDDGQPLSKRRSWSVAIAARYRSRCQYSNVRKHLAISPRNERESKRESLRRRLSSSGSGPGS